MALTLQQEQLEHELRVDQMTVNIEKMRADMQWEFWKVSLQLLAALGTAFAGGVAALGLVLHLMGKI